MNYVLDTHVWIWMNGALDRLSARAMETLTRVDKADKLFISAITLVELATLYAKKRVDLGESYTSWVSDALESSRVEIIAVDANVATATAELRLLQHCDPADRIIVATARLHGATLITADRILRKTRYVRTLW